MDVRIHDGLATGANEVRMRVRLLAVVAVAAAGTDDLQDLADLLEEMNGLVDRGQAGGGEIHFDFFMDLLNAWVILALKKCLEDGYSLRCDAEIALAQLGQNFIQSRLNIIHFGFPVNRTMMRMIVNK